MATRNKPDRSSAKSSAPAEPMSEYPTIAPQSSAPNSSAPAASTSQSNAPQSSGSQARGSLTDTIQSAPPPSSQVNEIDARLTETIAPAEREEAKTLNRYVIKKFHARGGMGEVWVSEDPHIGREVAIKRLLHTSVSAAERFNAEAQITGQLEHPCIVPVHDMGHDEAGQPYYVMKFVRGKSLKSTIGSCLGSHSEPGSKTELERAHLLNVFIGLCQAVAYAHSRGVLHRDIKPDNIMLGEFGEIVLLDWGLAKVSGQPELFGGGTSMVSTTSGSLANTEAGSVLGSPLYMPPEMAEGRTPDTDERTDIYLLGATLYEILTGKPPREGRSRGELIALARTAAPVAPRKICTVDKPIEAICLKAMSRRKEDRYASVTELLDDVNRYMVGEPVSAFKESFLARSWRWAKRHRVVLQRSAAVIAVVVASTVIFVKWRQIEGRRRIAQQQAAELQQRETARLQVGTFDRLLEEARFYAACTDPATEHAPYFDADKARVAAQAALAATGSWGDDLSQLPLQQDVPRLKDRIYELLLLMAQSRLQDLDSGRAQDALKLLDRAVHLTSTPSRGYYRLRSLCLGKISGVSPDQQTALAVDPKTPSTAFDCFLLGEELRRHAVAADEAIYSGLAAPNDRTHNIEEAVDQYSRALALDPTHYWAHFQLARCYLSLGRISDAVQALGTCVALRPNAPWSYSARGMSLALLGRYDEAKADVNHALLLDPEFLPALLNRGAVRWLQNDLKGALADFSQILQAPQNRRLTEAAFYRAQIYAQSGDLNSASADLDAVIAEKPDFAGALLLRGRIELLTGNTSACIADISRWLQNSRGVDFNSQNDQALLDRAELLRGMAAELPLAPMSSALELARRDINLALHMGNHTSRAYQDQGAVLDLLGDSAGAIAAYSQSLLADSRNNTSQINRGWAYQKIGNLPQAEIDFAAVIERNPDNAEAYVGLAYVEACQKKPAAARDNASQALLAGSGDYLILHNIACVYGQLSEDEPARLVESQNVALSMLEKAVQLWTLNSKGPSERRLIEQEPAFDAALRARPEFQKLIGTHP